MPLATIRSEPVTSIAQVEVLRCVRNATTGTYSHFNGHIAPIQQQAWWASMAGRVCAWLYYEDNTLLDISTTSYALIGYGLLRLVDERWWNSVAVMPEMQGRGYGAMITHHLTVVGWHHRPLYSSVSKDNLPGIRMHKSADWEVIDGPEPERLVYFRSRVSIAR